MTKDKFNRILKEKVKESTLKYLLGKKGTEIEYTTLELDEYLPPFGSNLTVAEQRDLFSFRNRMVDIPNHFPKVKTEFKCIGGEIENMKHIYNCEPQSEKKKNKVWIMRKYSKEYQTTNRCIQNSETIL
jgi:hypothetical protein